MQVRSAASVGLVPCCFFSLSAVLGKFMHKLDIVLKICQLYEKRHLAWGHRYQVPQMTLIYIILFFRHSHEALSHIFKTPGEPGRRYNIAIRGLKRQTREKTQKECGVFIVNILKLYSYLPLVLCAVFSLVIVNI